MRLRKRIVAGVVAVLAIAGVWWMQSGTDRAADEGRATSAASSARPVAGSASAPAQCRHRLLDVQVGEAWDYELTGEERAQQLRFQVEAVEPARHGYLVRWLAIVTEGDSTHEQRFVTECAPNQPIELPVDAFARAFATDWEPPACLFDDDLPEGTVMRDHASTEVGDLERACRIGSVEEVTVTAGSFDAVAVEVTDSRILPDGGTSVSRSTEWIAPDVGVVRAEYAGATLSLTRAP